MFVHIFTMKWKKNHSRMPVFWCIYGCVCVTVCICLHQVYFFCLFVCLLEQMVSAQHADLQWMRYLWEYFLLCFNIDIGMNFRRSTMTYLCSFYDNNNRITLKYFLEYHLYKLLYNSTYLYKYNIYDAIENYLKYFFI